MHYFLLTNHLVDEEHFRPLLDLANGTQPQITIILDCGGGNVSYALMLAHIINQNPGRFNLVAINIYSAAFVLFYQAACKKQMLKGGAGMVHYPYSRMEMMEHGKAYYNQDRNQINNNQEFLHRNTRVWCEEFMTEAELNRLEEGDDVFFTFLRLVEIFPDAEII